MTDNYYGIIINIETRKGRRKGGWMTTIGELEGVQPGGTVIVSGQGYIIVEVDEYKFGDFKWLNLVSHHQDSERLIVFEIAEGKVRRWDEVNLPGATVDDETLEYKREKFERDVTGIPHVSTHTEEEDEEGEISYSVLEAESENKLFIKENDDGEVTVYFSEGTVPLDAIRVL